MINTIFYLCKRPKKISFLIEGAKLRIFSEMTMKSRKYFFLYSHSILKIIIYREIMKTRPHHFMVRSKQLHLINSP